jgi:hypothetical protein
MHLMRWFRSLPPRWQLAILWIPSWGISVGLISLLHFGEFVLAAEGIVVGVLIGISSYLYVIRSGGW